MTTEKNADNKFLSNFLERLPKNQNVRPETKVVKLRKVNKRIKLTLANIKHNFVVLYVESASKMYLLNNLNNPRFNPNIAVANLKERLNNLPMTVTISDNI